MVLSEQVFLGSSDFSDGSFFDSVEARYRRAAACRTQEIVLDHSLIDDLSGCCARIYSQLDRDDDLQKRLARTVWLLKSSILQTLLPFDDARLGLRPMVDAFELQARNVPSIAGTVKDFLELLNSLVAAPLNPKRELFLKMLGKSNQATGVYAGLQGSLTPGWPASVSPPADFPGASCCIFRTRKEINHRAVDVIVIPGTLRFAPRAIVMDLLHGGRATEVTILRYKRERVFVPEPIRFPVDTRFNVAERWLNAIPAADEERDDGQLDQWANDSFWQDVRGRHAALEPISERDVKVAARFVLFADSSGAFLPDDKSVVEISALLDRPGEVAGQEERLPRKSVRELEEHDLVMMRLKGSGDYLDDVADRLMEQDGQRALRERATEWKSMLFRSIKRHGEGVVTSVGRDAGLKLRSASYLWNWASDVVIAPHDFETFRILIRTLSKLGEAVGYGNGDEYALERWEEMERLKVFHRRAASEIRKALLERVSLLVAGRHRVETVEVIGLPGLEAGSMGLLRVSAVDMMTVQVPLSRLFQLARVEVG